MTPVERGAAPSDARSTWGARQIGQSFAEPRAAQRVLDIPELVNLIVDELELGPRTRLPQLNRAFCHSFARPQVWAARTAPSTIDWTRRVVRTERCMTLHKIVDLHAPVAWQYAGESWCLHRARRAAGGHEEDGLDWVSERAEPRMRLFLAARPLIEAAWAPAETPAYFDPNNLRRRATLSFLEERWERKQAHVVLLEPQPACGLSEQRVMLLTAAFGAVIWAGLSSYSWRVGDSGVVVALQLVPCLLYTCVGLPMCVVFLRRAAQESQLFEAYTDALGPMPQARPAQYPLAGAISWVEPRPAWRTPTKGA